MPTPARQQKARVLILYTGGTFGMTSRGPGAALKPMPVTPPLLMRNLLTHVPELSRLARCEIAVLFNRDSAHIGPTEWLVLAREIERRWMDFDGIVILHGTDTLAYTASALSFLLRPCKRPVVITGAQRPLAELRSDARQNLISAVEIAAQGVPALRQVTVFFDDQLLQGNRARKRSAFDFHAFESPRLAPLAEVGTEIFLHKHPAPRFSKRKIDARFSEKVALLHVTPGFPAASVRRDLLHQLDGLLLLLFPSGTAPTHDPELLKLAQDARSLGLPLVLVSEGSRTSGHPMEYEAGRVLLSHGCHWAGAMTPECAFVKTSLILGQKNGRENFARYWKEDWAGEGTD